MIRAFFLDVKNGRLSRLPFLGYTLLLNFFGLLFIFGLVATIAGAETMMGGDIAEAQAVLRNAFSGPLVFVILGVFFASIFASLNLAAKRLRDIGMPGWLTVLAIVVVTVLVSRLISQNASQMLSFGALIALLVIPPGMVNRS